MKTLLSLFDMTGTASQPYWDAGWDVTMIDIQHGDDINDFCCEHIVENLPHTSYDHVIMQPPCTDFTNAGARLWKDKDHDGRTAISAELVLQGLRTIEFIKPDVWWLENPIGRIDQVVDLGPRRAIIQPWHYGQITKPTAAELQLLAATAEKAGREAWDEITADEIAASKRTNAYTKQTGLWGYFRLPEKQPIDPVKVCKQGSWLMKLGGKSAKTKNLRSATPEGFAQAMFDANKDLTIDFDQLEEDGLEWPGFDQEGLLELIH